ncbi:glycoside hydrolase family 30 protein [Pedobacter boryungensis]|uniref:Glycoside hydrolase family 30 protein n=1 Tax=Pedobacter boryungensis TaxID=869962 RepID=A0ABX2DH58_9SPHI|nr:glycoside hydrolase family 30 protein [Pedobacter boryungensis]NQX32631.1 glycoside hydrolase family 30 protein [Pedobacter boryungensis]
MNKSKHIILLATLAFITVTSFAQQKAKISISTKKVFIYSTVKGSDKPMEETKTLAFKALKQPVETQTLVFVDPNKTFQTFIGIGGAITDASAEVFAKLPKATQQEFLTAYYDKNKGIGYTIARTNINSCDFSSGSYTYVAENDKALKTFNIDHDRKFKIPLIKQATATAGGKINLYVSPWSPPAWMKTNNSMLKGGSLLPAYNQSWANYYVKFIQAYEKEGMPIWGLTVQNEPMATQRWESCLYTAEEERDFIKNFLGPTLHKNNMASKKLIGWDHNRDLIYQRASTLLNDPQTAKYLWGVGFHWYETWTGSSQNFENLKRVHEAFPTKQLIFTEGCVEKFSLDRIDDWSLGERYGLSMINDFNAGTAAWTDWNILLDENGGPNHVGNFCFAPIHANVQTGKLMYTNSYYYIGHFSKFIKPGAKRIISSPSRSMLISTAFQNPDGSIVVVVMNNTDQKLPYQLWMQGNAAETESLPHSISTLIIK